MKEKNDLKEWRAEQIASVLIYRYCEGIKIEKSDNPLFDLLVTSIDNEPILAIEVGGKYVEGAQTYSHYIDTLKKSIYSLDAPRYPIASMWVNEEMETANIAFLYIIERYGPIFVSTPDYISVDEVNMPKFLDRAKAKLENKINVLDSHNWKFVKKLNITKDIAGQGEVLGTIVYLRDFSPNYKIDDNKYPHDELDTIILEFAKSNFKWIGGEENILIETAELKKLMEYKNYHSVEAEIRIIPDTSVIPNEFLKFINGIELKKFNIEIYCLLPNETQAFGNSGMTKVLRVSDKMEKFLPKWITKLSELNKMLSSMHPVSEIWNEQ